MKINKHPNINEEKKLWKKGYKIVAGIDEAGRGPLAGPVVAAVVAIKRGANLKIFKNIKDSKKLSPKKREEFYNILINNPDIFFGVGRVSEKIIDRINIFEATKLAMKKAVKNLKNIPIDFLLIDGNFGIGLKIAQKSIIKGDEKVLSCSLASIIAKVERDKIMAKIHKKFPFYGFDRHKGYGTKYHLEMIKKHGPLVIHRATFNPVFKMIKSNNKSVF